MEHKANIFSAKPEYLAIIDPQNRTGKIRIPLTQVFETRGKSEALRSRNQKDLSLCLLFQNGRCNAGAKCHQIHCDCEFVQKLRENAKHSSTCCASHGDPQSKELVGQERTVLFTTETNIHVPVPVSRFASTNGLISALHSRGSVSVTSQRICRLHQQNRCKYGRDCRHMHMCRETMASILNKSYVAETKATAATRSAKTPTPPTSPSRRMSTTPPLPLSPDLILDDANSTASSGDGRATTVSDSVSSSLPDGKSVSTSMRTVQESTTATLAAEILLDHDSTKTGSRFLAADSCTTVSSAPPTDRFGHKQRVATPDTNSVLESYLKGWNPVIGTAAPSPSYPNMRSPLDLRILCTDILGN